MEVTPHQRRAALLARLVQAHQVAAPAPDCPVAVARAGRRPRLTVVQAQQAGQADLTVLAAEGLAPGTPPVAEAPEAPDTPS
jgi:hypothetical protein